MIKALLTAWHSKCGAEIAQSMALKGPKRLSKRHSKREESGSRRGSQSTQSTDKGVAQSVYQSVYQSVFQSIFQSVAHNVWSVSYTQLTLPTHDHIEVHRVAVTVRQPNF